MGESRAFLLGHGGGDVNCTSRNSLQQEGVVDIVYTIGWGFNLDYLTKRATLPLQLE